MKVLAEEMQAISKGLEKVEQELTLSENDGLVSQAFHKVDCHDQNMSRIFFVPITN